MVQVLQANQITCHDVEVKFGLQLENHPGFFTEWQVPNLDLSDYQRQVLD
ncbi:MAG: hypothetical protein AAFW84_31435 [Cyanobacteria bacterium J06635_15]